MKLTKIEMRKIRTATTAIHSAIESIRSRLSDKEMSVAMDEDDDIRFLCDANLSIQQINTDKSNQEN
jgi:hypothetical protein